MYFSGVCREGERLVVGPTDEGRFLRLRVGSIQRNRSACRVLRAGQAATLALGNFDRSLLRKVRGHTTEIIQRYCVIERQVFHTELF